jgi:glutathione S-transferase
MAQHLRRLRLPRGGAHDSSRPRSQQEERQTARAALERVDVRLNGAPFILGEHITLTDLYLAPQVSNVREKAPELLASLDAHDRWAAVTAERDTFKHTSYDAATFRRN